MTAIQTLSYLAVFLLPVYISVKFSLWGIIYGGFCFWVLMGVVSYLNISESNLGGVGFIFWLFFGWPIGILYCTTAVLVVSMLIRVFRL